MGSFASGTEVPAERSRAEIEATLRRYGAEQFVSGYDNNTALIGFSANGRQVRFILPLPDVKAEEFTKRTEKRGNGEFVYDNTPAQVQRRYDQAVRQRWRALLLCIKAKLEAVDTGISSFEDEFLPHIVLPDNRTVGEHIRPKIVAAYALGKMPRLLPSFGGDE